MVRDLKVTKKMASEDRYRLPDSKTSRGTTSYRHPTRMTWIKESSRAKLDIRRLDMYHIQYIAPLNKDLKNHLTYPNTIHTILAIVTNK